MSDDVNTKELGQAIKVDWTIDPNTGKTNSSPEFVRLTDEIERILRNSAHDLMGGGTDTVARLILARLAHVHKLAPASVEVHEATETTPGNLQGIFNWNQQLFELRAKALEVTAPE